MNILYYSLTIAAFLFIWFHTYFLAEYYKLFGISGWKLMDNFLIKSKDGFYISFPDWMGQNKSGNRFKVWLYSLLSCPFCIGLILNLPILAFGFLTFGASYFLTILAYLLLKNLHN